MRTILKKGKIHYAYYQYFSRPHTLQTLIGSINHELAAACTGPA
jgi:hypothetical protein